MAKAVVVFFLATSLALAGAQPSIAQTPEPRFAERAFVTAIDVVAEVRDAKGATPADLTPADFRLLENGVERKIIAVEYLDPARAAAAPDASASRNEGRSEWQIVVWLDAMTSSRATLAQSTAELRKRAAELLKLGPVTLIYSDLAPDLLVESTRDPRALAAAIDRARKRAPGDRVARIRQEFLTAVDNVTTMALPGAEGEQITMGAVDGLIPGYVAEEERLLGIGRANLLSWLARIPKKMPRMLVYVGDGFDLDPADFYIRTLEASGGAQEDPAQLRSRVQARTVAASDAMARALAIGGWTALAIGGTQTHFADGVARGGGRRFSGTQTGAAPAFIFLNPGAPLAQLAEETGGERIGSAATISAALEDLSRRIRITYQVDREPDPEPRRVAILPLRAGLTVRAPEWTSSTTSDAVAEARALELLGGGDARGDLDVTATLLRPSGTDPSVEARIDFAPLAAAARQIGATKVRMTVAVAIEGAPAQVFHRIAEIKNLASQAGLIWTAPIRLDEKAGAIAVVAEELTTGSWGGARVARGGETAEAKVAFPPIAPAPPSSIASALPAVSREQAIARAAAERKLVFAFEWDAGCRGCSQIEETATTNTEVAARLRGFVVLPAAASTWTGDPRVAVYDPAGDLFVSWPAIGEQRAERRYLSAGDLTALLQRAAAAAPHVLRARDQQAAGDPIGAQLAFALAYRESDELALAETAYEKAARLARDAADDAKEQTANALRALTVARRGRPADAVRDLQAIIAAPATRLNEAEARLVLGMIHRASGDESKAATEIQAVLRLAPRDSEAYRAALEISRGEPGAVGLADPNDPSGRRLQLVIGGRPPFSGKTRLQVIVRDPEISSVAFRVDQEPAITDAAPPFEARVDLGNVPRRREIRATARGAKGNVVAEDAIVLNERHDEFWVRLRSEEGSRLVRAETNLPTGAKARSLAFSVDGKPVPPLPSDAAAIRLPSDEPVLVRVVASLEDGRTAEDAALMGAIGYAETIEARDVEIYASVLDPSGSPLGALDRSQFAIEENGRKKRLAGFEFLGRAPFSVGIAVDSSSSMRDAMPDVHRTARAFLDLATRDGSSAFVVDFDTTPRLAAARTRDRALLQNAVSLIRADGSTALYDAVIFGLLQLQGVPGKRALIVLTDGRDETSRYGLKDAVRVARESGVAIYAIILAQRSGNPVSTPGMPSAGGPRGAIYPMRGSRAAADPGLETIAAESGGRAWYLPESANMETIYRAIDLELRNQYRLTYRTSPGRGSSDWREVRVRVDEPGATVRTAAGFVAQ